MGTAPPTATLSLGEGGFWTKRDPNSGRVTAIPGIWGRGAVWGFFLVQLEFLNAPNMHAGLPGPQHRLQFARQAGSTAAHSAKAPAFHREMGQLERGHPGFLRSSLWSPQGQKVERHEWACGIEGQSS